MIVTGTFAPTVLVVIGNVAVVLPALTVNVAGTVATVVAVHFSPESVPRMRLSNNPRIILRNTARGDPVSTTDLNTEQ